MTDAPKKGIALIVDRIPPPGARKPPADNPGGEGEDYSAAKDSMAAFMAAVKSGDVDQALDAYQDVMRNCAPEPDADDQE